MSTAPFSPSAEAVLRARYLAKDDSGRVVETAEGLLDRVAGAVASAEALWGGAAAVAEQKARFLELMGQGLFLPNSPTLMNAGRPLGQLSACFVIPVEDDLASIFEAIKQTALIHKSGGGTGFSFSRLRPAGDQVASTGGVSSGPVSFMQVFDTATEAIKQGGTRRGANMGILSADHPDIELFINCKRALGRLQNFNISVTAPDAFMAAASAGAGWDLINPRSRELARTVDAGELLGRIVAAAHAGGEPGLAFIDAINRAQPTPHLGRIEATNPCGEQPLLPHESCNLGSLVLPRFVKNGQVDYPALEEAARLAVRFLDDAVEVNRFPLTQVAQATRLTRKVGLGVMGFADLCIDLGLAYASDQAANLAREIMTRVSAAGREASVELGQARGSFPAFPRSRWRERGFTHLRNATVTTVAPTGTLSLLAGCSSGIEPLYALAYTRRVLEDQTIEELNPRFTARLAELDLGTPANLEAVRATGRAGAVEGLPAEVRALFATAHEIAPRDHLAIQAACQEATDNAVSKTVNLPVEAPVEAVREVFTRAWELGLKGVTVFRDRSRGRQVLELVPLPGGSAATSPAPPPRPGRCPRCGGVVATDGGCRTCAACGASNCE